MTILSDIADAIAQLIDKTAERIVAIDAGGRHAASGIIWRQGLVVTANEALGDEERVELILPNGKTAAAKLAGRDASTDIALLRAEGTFEAVDPFKPAAAVKAGHWAIAVGRSSQGALASSGVVKEAGAAWHSWAGGLIDRRILLDLALDRRAHGGAVIDAAGDLIGIAAFAPRYQALVIPTQTVELIADRLKSEGGVARGYLGAGLHSLKTRGERSGVIVVDIDENGPAKRAGLFVGDVVTHWNGEAIASVRDVLKKLGPDSLGSTVVLDVMRANQPARLEVAIGIRPHK